MLALREIREDEYAAVYAHMKRDFPAGEIAPYFAIRENLEDRTYEGFYLTEDTDIGYALITAPENIEYALINYLAIFPQFREKGYGSGFLKILLERYGSRIIFLETEDPKALKRPERVEIAERRIRFYQRAGFHIVPTSRARIFGFDMLIMASKNDRNLSARKAMHALYLPSLGSRHYLHFIDVKDKG